MSGEQQRIRDHSGDRRYFTMVPHLVTDMLVEGQLTPLAFALYVYYRRCCGEHGDSFSESVRATANSLHVSHGAVHTARKSLVDCQLVDLNLAGPLGHEIAEITIRDVWHATTERYSQTHRRPNIGRNSRLASGDSRTQNGPGVQILDATPDASVQILDAPIPLPENVKKPGKPGKEPEEATLDELRADARPVVPTQSDPAIEGGIAYVVERYVTELGDNDPRATALACTHLLHRSGLEPGEFHNAMKAAAAETRRRLRTLTNPAAYWQTTLRTCIDQRRQAIGLPPLEQVRA